MAIFVTPIFVGIKKRQRLICVREDHSNVNHEQKIEERSEIVAIDLAGKVQALITGADFYSNPRLNSTNDKLSYLCWNHPQMPWDGTECYCASINAEGDISDSQLIAGSKTESVFQPQWSPNDELFFVSDRNNWWNIYRHRFNPNLVGENIKAEIICDMPAEFATPQWVFGMSTYGFLNDTEICCCFSQQGQWNLGIIHTQQKTLSIIPNDFKDISGICCHNKAAYFLAASATQGSALYRLNRRHITPVLPSKGTPLTSEDITQAEPVSFATSDSELAYGFFLCTKEQTGTRI